MTKIISPRVRFAPSPTGFLHIGSARVALFNWLYARQHGGQFLLRIEDTDRDRSEDRFTQDIMASLKWLGLTWDETPLFQSQRLMQYQETVEALIAHDHAYRCDCTPDEIDAMRAQATQEGKKPQYDRRCRERHKPVPSSGKPFVVRAKIPLQGSIQFVDQIRGPICFQNEDLDDFVLMRSNGAPTYQLSVVVDDVASQITHILRGDDHINNTPKQIHLYQFLNAPLPDFAHLPMILGADKKKLSKRHGAVSACTYRSEGYLPEALLNFLARLGWSHGDQEVFSIQEMIQYFSFEHVQKSSAVFNLEKLLWLNGQYLKNKPPEQLAEIIRNEYADQCTPLVLEHLHTTIGLQCIHFIQPKVKLIPELINQLLPLYTPDSLAIEASDLKWNSKNPNDSSDLKTNIQTAIREALTELNQLQETHARLSPFKGRIGPDRIWGQYPALADLGFLPANVDAFFRQLSERFGIRLGDLMHPIRLGVTGKNGSAGLFEVLAFLPWDRVEMRLKTMAAL